MKKILILILILISFVSSFGQGFVPNEVQVKTNEPTLWNKEAKTTSFLSLFPVGSRVIGCADMPLYRAQNNPITGEYYGTTFLVELPTSNAAAVVADSAIYLSKSMGRVARIYLNIIGDLTSSAPISFSDPDFATGQYHMKYDLAAIAGGVKYTGWQHATGYVFSNTHKVIVAVLDGGVNFTHQDVVNAYWVNPGEIAGNSIDDDADGYVDDFRGWDFVNTDADPSDDNPIGHGSHVFGIIAARNDNSHNICGIVTDSSSAMVLKVADVSGTVSDFNTAAGYYYALAHGAKVVNMSFGFTSVPSSLMGAISTGVATPYKTVPVAAIGNTGGLYYAYPASGAHVLSVGNANSGGVRDPSSSYSDSLKVMCRGVNVKSISATSSTATVVMSGSSMSAPFAAGWPWWILKIDSTLTVDQVIAEVISYGTNHTWLSMTGYGYLVGLDTMCYNYMKPDSVVTFAACSGKYALPYTHHFTIVDSLRYGISTITGDSINTNSMTPGTYTYYMAWKSEPHPGIYYRDTFKLKVVITPGTVVTPSVSLAATPSGAVCAGTSVAFTATPTNGGTSPTYQWEVNSVIISGATNATYTYIPANGDVVKVTMTSSIACVTTPTATSTVTMTVNPVTTTSVTIAASPSGPVCTGTTVTFTPSPIGGGTSPTYVWKLNGTTVATTTTYSNSSLITGDNVWVVMTSNAPCPSPATVTSNTVTMTVGAPVTPTISVSPSPSGPVCAGTAVTYTATITNGGTSPAYQWKVNGIVVGGSTATYAYTPANGDVITCRLTSSLSCVTTPTVTSTPITATVNPLTPNSVTIAATPSATICAGTAVTFTPTPVGGGSSPSYTWKLNGVSVGFGTTYSSSTLATSDHIWVVMVSSAPCPSPASVTSNTVTMTVNPIIVPSVTIVPTPGSSICAGTSVTFTPTPVGGGSPTYSWKLNGTAVGTGTTYTSSTLITGDLVWVTMTSTALCATPAAVTSNTVTMTVSSPVTPSSSASATATSICSLNDDTLTASCSVVGATLQWQSFGGSWTNITGATTSPYYTGTLPVGANQFRGVFTMPAGCFTRSFDTTSVVTITVNAAVPVPAPTVAGVPVFVGTGHYKAVFTATISGGIGAYNLDWHINGSMVATTTVPTYVDDPFTSDVCYVVLRPIGGCYFPDSSSSVSIVINAPLAVAAVTGETIKIFPNPVKDWLSIEGLYVDGLLIVENAIGQKVIDYKLDGKTSEQVDLHNLTPGLYTFRIFDTHHALITAGKIIKGE